MKGVQEPFNIKGHLKITANEGMADEEVVFDGPNLIVDEGKGYLMDYLSSMIWSPSYPLTPFSAIVLTKNVLAAAPSDTFINSVWDQSGPHQISDEGVLHIAGGFTSVSHVQQTPTILLTGIIQLPYGNNPANNHINSVCVCIGTTPNVGGPGQIVYTSPAGAEKLFSRVHVGDLIKTNTKSFTFAWTFTFI